MNLLENKKINKFLQILASIFILNSKKRRKIKENLKEVLKNKYKKHITSLINNKYSDYYCFFSRYGIGDIFFVASLIKEFKKKNNNIKVVYFTEKKHLIPYLKSFNSIDEIVFDEKFSQLQNLTLLQRKPKVGKLSLLFFPYKGKKETYTFADNYNNLLNLPLNTEREIPIISKQDKINADDEFKRLNLNPSKTIVLIPEATMFDYRFLKPSFWINLAKKLEEQGYDVVFNTNNKSYQNFKTTFLPVMEFLAFSLKVNHIISFRSGINDLLVGCNLNNIIAIYPPNFEVIWAKDGTMEYLNKNHIKKYDNEFDNVFNIYSLNSNFDRNDIKEFFIGDNEKKLEKQILNSIK